MLKKLWLGALAGCVFSTAAIAQDSPVDVDVSAEFVSKYVWNAFDRVESRGLDSGPVVQPRVEVGFATSPLRAHVGGSFVVNDDSELHETVYGVSIVRGVSPLVNVGVGYNYYDDQVSSVGGVAVDDVNGHEVWGKVSVSNSVGVDPSVAVKFEKPSVDGADSYFVVVGGVVYDVPVVSSVGAGQVGFGVKAHTDVVYNSGVTVNDVDVVNSGVSAWQVGVTGDVALPSGVVVSPHVNYQVTVEDTVNDKNPVWAGVNVRYSF